jgi:hypothetical protein
MKVNLRISNKPISFRAKFDKTPGKVVEGTIERKITKVTMIRIALTRSTKRNMMINDQLRKVRRRSLSTLSKDNTC